MVIVIVILIIIRIIVIIIMIRILIMIYFGFKKNGLSDRPLSPLLPKKFSLRKIGLSDICVLVLFSGLGDNWPE